MLLKENRQNSRLLLAIVLTGALLLSPGCTRTEPSSASPSSVSQSQSSPQSIASESASSVPSSSSSSPAVGQPSETAASPESSSQTASSTSGFLAPIEVERSWWADFLASVPRDLASCDYRLYDNKRRISAYGSYDLFSREADSGALDLLGDTAREVPETDLGEKRSFPSFFEIWIDYDSIKYTGYLYENGISLASAPRGEEAGQPVYLAIKEEDYQLLLTRMEETLTNLGQQPAYPSWLTLMRPSKCSTITGYRSDGEKMILDEGSAERLNVFERLQNISVQPDSVRSVPPDTQLPDSRTILIDFVNGIQYRLQTDGVSLLVASSDMSTALRYTLGDEKRIDTLFNADSWDYEANPSTAKPVIYLYPQKPVDVSVKVDYQGIFTYTYPAYNGGWLVTAYPDGKLINHADGSEHYYLFWEGNASKAWTFEEGFCVPGDQTEAFLVDALERLGLTPREYNDFIVYWLPKMQNNPYNLITFATGEYEALAPMEITPKPDSVLRVHMVYKALKEPVEIPAQALPSFERNGFTVVEWGGSKAN